MADATPAAVVPDVAPNPAPTPSPAPPAPAEVLQDTQANPKLGTPLSDADTDAAYKAYLAGDTQGVMRIVGASGDPSAFNQRLDGLAAEQDGGRLALALQLGHDIPPDRAAQIYEQAQKTGLPYPDVDRSLDQIKAATAAPDFDAYAFRTKSPVVARLAMQDPRVAAMMRPDLDKLGDVEGFFQSIKAGFLSTEQAAALGYARQGVASGQRDIPAEFELFKLQQQIARTADPGHAGILDTMANFAGKLTGLGVEAASGFLPHTAGYVTGDPINNRLVLGQAAATALGNGWTSLADARDINGKQLDPATRTAAAYAIGGLDLAGQVASVVPGIGGAAGKGLSFGAEAIGKRILTQSLLDAAKSPTVMAALARQGAKMGTSMADLAAFGVVGEGGETLTRNLAQIYDQETNARQFGTTWGSTARDSLEAAWHGAIDQMEAMGPVVAFTHAPGALLDVGSAAIRALDRAAALRQAGTTMAETNVAKTPIAAQNIAQSLAGHYAPTVSVPYQDWAHQFENPEAAATAVIGPEGAKAWADAVAGKHDLEIPTGNYLTEIATKPEHAALSSSVRFGPGEMNEKEAILQQAGPRPEALPVPEEAKSEAPVRPPVADSFKALGDAVSGATALDPKAISDHVANITDALTPKEEPKAPTVDEAGVKLANAINGNLKAKGLPGEVSWRPATGDIGYDPKYVAPGKADGAEAPKSTGTKDPEAAQAAVDRAGADLDRAKATAMGEGLPPAINRPDLARVSGTAEGRMVEDRLIGEHDMNREVRSDAEQAERSAAITGVANMIMDKARTGGTYNADEALAAKNHLRQLFAEDPDSPSTQELYLADRINRAEWGRAGRSLRDTDQTPAERMGTLREDAMNAADAASGLHPEELARANTEIRDLRRQLEELQKRNDKGGTQPGNARQWVWRQQARVDSQFKSLWGKVRADFSGKGPSRGGIPGLDHLTDAALLFAAKGGLHFADFVLMVTDNVRQLRHDPDGHALIDQSWDDARKQAPGMETRPVTAATVVAADPRYTAQAKLERAQNALNALTKWAKDETEAMRSMTQEKRILYVAGETSRRTVPNDLQPLLDESRKAVAEAKAAKEAIFAPFEDAKKALRPGEKPLDPEAMTEGANKSLETATEKARSSDESLRGQMDEEKARKAEREDVTPPEAKAAREKAAELNAATAERKEALKLPEERGEFPGPAGKPLDPEAMTRNAEAGLEKQKERAHLSDDARRGEIDEAKARAAEREAATPEEAKVAKAKADKFAADNAVRDAALKTLDERIQEEEAFQSRLTAALEQRRARWATMRPEEIETEIKGAEADRRLSPEVEAIRQREFTKREFLYQELKNMRPKSEAEMSDAEKAIRAQLKARETRIQQLAAASRDEYKRIKAHMKANGFDLDEHEPAWAKDPAKMGLAINAMDAATGGKMDRFLALKRAILHMSLRIVGLKPMTDVLGGSYQIAGRTASSLMNHGKPGGPSFGEIGHMLGAMYKEGVPAAWRAFKETWSTGINSYEMGRHFGRDLTLEEMRDRFSHNPFSRNTGKLGKVEKFAYKLAQSQDAFFKTLYGIGEVHAQAYRSAIDGLGNRLEGDDLRNHMEAQVSNPNSEAWERANDFAQKATFSSPNSAAALINRAQYLRATDRVPEHTARLVRWGAQLSFPFTLIPLNVLKASADLGTFHLLPIGMRGLAALRGEAPYKSEQIYSDLGKVAINGMILGGGLYMAGLTNAQGQRVITGFNDADDPGVIRAFGHSFKYGRVPGGVALGTYLSMLRRGDTNKTDAIAALHSAIEEEPLLSFWTDVSRAVEMHDISDFIGSQATSFIPPFIGQTASAIRNTVPAWNRDDSVAGHSLRQFNPSAPPKVDVYGRDVEKQGIGPWATTTVWRMFSPVQLGRVMPETSVDAARIAWNQQHPSDPLEFRAPGNDVTVNGEQIHLTDSQRDQAIRASGTDALAYGQEWLRAYAAEYPNQADPLNPGKDVRDMLRKSLSEYQRSAMEQAALATKYPEVRPPVASPVDAAQKARDDVDDLDFNKDKQSDKRENARDKAVQKAEDRP